MIESRFFTSLIDAATKCAKFLVVTVFLFSGTLAAAGSETDRSIPPDADQRVTATRGLLSSHRDCDAHRSLQWLIQIRPQGVYFADGAFADRKYGVAFEAYKGVVAVSRVDDPAHPAALDEVLSLAQKRDYDAAMAAIPKIPPPRDDLTSLISGNVYFAAGRTAQAKKTWINGIGNTSVPGGSALYRGPSLSLLYLLDRMILARECPDKARTTRR